MNKTLQKIVLSAVLFGAVQATFAADPKPEEEIRYRQSSFNVIGRSFGYLGAVAKGEKPYDQAAAVKAASVVDLLSTLPFGSFVAGTDGVVPGFKHKADPKIWSEPAKFKEAAEKFQFEAAKLPAAAKDLETLKLQVGAVGKTC